MPKFEIIGATVVHTKDLSRYGDLVAEHLTNDEPFQQLIRMFGHLAYEEALDLIILEIFSHFLRGTLPAPAADAIKNKFYAAAKNYAEQTALLNMPIQGTH